MNSSQGVDLEALNLSMTHALIPTILYLVLIMVVGVVGNIIVLLVYYRRFKPSSTRSYILAMSVCDLLTCVISMPGEILAIKYYFAYDMPLLCKCNRALNCFLINTSAFILTTVATDRFSKVCLKKCLSMRRIYINILICALVSLAVSVFYGTITGSRTVPTSVGNITGVKCLISDASKYTLFPLVYSMMLTLNFVTCLVIILASYIRIALELWRHKKRQTSAGGVVPMVDAADIHHRDNITGNALGSVHNLGHSETSSSGPEPTPHESMHTRNTTLTDMTTVVATRGSDKQFQVSFKGLSLQQPDLSDSDDACCSGYSTDNISISSIVCNDQESNNTHDEKDDLTTFQRNPIGATSSKDDITPSRNTHAIALDIPEIIISEYNNVPDDASSLHSTQPANDACTPHHHNFINRSRSLLGRLLTPMTRRDQVQTGKKTSAVKTIPSSTTTMMFVLAITFIVSFLPFLIFNILYSIPVTFGQGMTGIKLNLLNIGWRSPYINCGVNSIVYGFCNPRFRQKCRLLFARKR